MKEIKCFNIKEGYYITEDGDVYSKLVNQYDLLETPRLLTSSIDKDGYYHLKLVCNDGKRRQFRIHRLVAKTYLGNPSNFPIVLHLDNDVQHNHYTNLKWGTVAENTQLAYNDGLCSINREIEVYDLDGHKLYEFISVSEMCRYFDFKRGSETQMIRRCLGKLPNPPTRGRMKNYVLQFK